MTKRPAPQLLFDDGSRAIQQAAAAASADPVGSARGSVSISTYYEVDRIAAEIVNLMHQKKMLAENQHTDEWFARVALQFPDQLLSDSPEVCWALEDALEQLHHPFTKNNNKESPEKQPSLVFCLGDTTFGPCCPDEVAALHLNADVLVHYGHACLSHPPKSLPVLYSFGVAEHWDTQAAVQTILGHAKNEGVRRLLLLYQVQYQHAMEDLQTQLSERGDVFVVVGEIPEESLHSMLQQNADVSVQKTCCGASEECASKFVDDNVISDTITSGSSQEEQSSFPSLASADEEPAFLVGGLQVPKNLDLSSFTLVFIGDQTTDGRTEGLRQYMNTALWYLTTKNKPGGFWTYSPLQKTLETSIPPGVQRQLNRRFYLIQKARDASLYGILIGTLSQRYFRSVVQTLRSLIEKNGRSSYTFAMGKVNPAKIANFAEIECFIMVACAETSWLDEGEQREMHIPIITPLELHMALGAGGPEVQWGECDYSLDYTDFLLQYQKQLNDDSPLVNDDADSDDGDTGSSTGAEDAPYYSLVTGKYESTKKSTAEGVDLTALPGKGQLTTYKSEAAEFLKKREYKGLETQLGQTQVRSAQPGQQGIASMYNNGLESTIQKDRR